MSSSKLRATLSDRLELSSDVRTGLRREAPDETDEAAVCTCRGPVVLCCTGRLSSSDSRVLVRSMDSSPLASGLGLLQLEWPRAFLGRSGTSSSSIFGLAGVAGSGTALALTGDCSYFGVWVLVFRVTGGRTAFLRSELGEPVLPDIDTAAASGAPLDQPTASADLWFTSSSSSEMGAVLLTEGFPLSCDDRGDDVPVEALTNGSLLMALKRSSILVALAKPLATPDKLTGCGRSVASIEVGRECEGLRGDTSIIRAECTLDDRFRGLGLVLLSESVE